MEREATVASPTARVTSWLSRMVGPLVEGSHSYEGANIKDGPQPIAPELMRELSPATRAAMDADFLRHFSACAASLVNAGRDT